MFYSMENISLQALLLRIVKCKVKVKNPAVSLFGCARNGVRLSKRCCKMFSRVSLACPASTAFESKENSQKNVYNTFKTC